MIRDDPGGTRATSLPDSRCTKQEFAASSSTLSLIFAVRAEAFRQMKKTAVLGPVTLTSTKVLVILCTAVPALLTSAAIPWCTIETEKLEKRESQWRMEKEGDKEVLTLRPSRSKSQALR